MLREELIQVARGEAEAELVLRNARVVNVFSGDVHVTDVAIARSCIAGLGEYRAHNEIDLQERYLAPGFIDGHVHIESSMLSVPEFARAVVPRGTTSVVADPHEIANVLGLDGVRYILETSKYNPLSVFVMAPSCVPATALETAGSHLSAEDLEPLMADKWVIGLAEMMNYPGVLFRDPAVLAKVQAAGRKAVDGHAPGLSGKDLNAYVAAGVGSDHECTTVEEAREKLRLGLHIMIREGSAARNLRSLLPLVSSENARRCFFITDDRHPLDLVREGHIDHLLREAIGAGLPPVTAIQMATLNTAEYFGLHDRGAVAPGRRADLVVFSDLQQIRPEMVFRGGRLVARDGQLLPDVGSAANVPIRGSMNVAPLDEGVFRVPAAGSRLRVIGVVPGQIVTEKLMLPPKVEAGEAVADVSRDLLKLAVVERHLSSGRVAVGFARGFGLRRGAIATSVAHDSHNVVALGTNDADMLAAVRAIISLGGGLVAVADGQPVATLPLPIAGLMSREPLETVTRQLEALLRATQELGCPLRDPFMSLSFLALPVIPALKLTDRGLVDVTQFRFVPLFEP
ncbi:MAG: adenine deaminase [Anaerolineae bacterium]|nr:adenine deaminase [Anaerolineae bacterium]